MCPRLGVVGAGRHSRAHLRPEYALRDQRFLGCDSDADYPHRIDHDYSEEAREWAVDVSDLRPEVTAVFDPSAEARAAAVEFCAERGDDPATHDSLEALTRTAAPPTSSTDTGRPIRTPSLRTAASTSTSRSPTSTTSRR